MLTITSTLFLSTFFKDTKGLFFFSSTKAMITLLKPEIKNSGMQSCATVKEGWRYKYHKVQIHHWIWSTSTNLKADGTLRVEINTDGQRHCQRKGLDRTHKWHEGMVRSRQCILLPQMSLPPTSSSKKRQEISYPPTKNSCSRKFFKGAVSKFCLSLCFWHVPL